MIGCSTETPEPDPSEVEPELFDPETLRRPEPELAAILSDPNSKLHCSREAIPESLLDLLGWTPVENFIAERDSPFTEGCVSFDDSPPSRQLIFSVELGTRWLIFYFQGGIGFHQAVKAIDLSNEKGQVEEGSLFTECLNPICLEEALREGKMMRH